MDKRRLLVIFLLCTILAICLFPHISSQIDTSTTKTTFLDASLQYTPEIISLNQESLNSTSTNSSTHEPSPIPTPIPVYSPTQSNIATNISPPTSYSSNEILASPSPSPTPIENSRELQKAINALGKTGGEIVLQSDQYLSEIDISVTSNVVLSGVDSNVTLHLMSKRLNVAVNATNVVIKNLTIDASYLGDRNVLAIYAGSKNVTLTDIEVQNHFSNKSAIISLGSNVTLSNLAFINVSEAYPMQIAGSYSNVRNCSSNDQATYALVTMGGAISDVTIEHCVANNRPLFNGGYTRVSSSNLWIVNNTIVGFPKWTYGILIQGGAGDPIQAPFDNVYILDNKVKAGFLAYNAIAIYGLSSNVLVANNTVDQHLSGHNAIGVSSGVNVTVTQNTVFGATENSEGGIEVESNPVHNRLIGISENVTVTKNLVFNCTWGIYVRVMAPNHENWAGATLLSKNILIEGNMVYNCSVGVNLLQGENIIVRDNNISSNIKPFKVDPLNVYNYSENGNLLQ
jgi:parallel beta-helix repeat protein